MDKRRQTPADKAGFRTKRMRRRDEELDQDLDVRQVSRAGWRPADDIFGDGRRMSPTVDTDLDFEGHFGKK